MVYPKLHDLASSALRRKWSLFLWLMLSLSFHTMQAQLNFDYQAGKFLIKGTVIDIQTKKPVPLANILIVNLSRGITCDNEGNFALYVHPYDTLKFSSVGYISKVIHISDVDSSKYYTLEISLMKDFVKLKEVSIYPYRTLEDFRKAFVEAKEVNKVVLPGVAKPKYSNRTPSAKFYNPISFLYERMHTKKRAADPDFKP